MLVYQLVKFALAAAALLGPPVIAQTHCDNPSVRREWRSMPPQERAEWIDAVKVGVSNNLLSLFPTSLTIPPLVSQHATSRPFPSSDL